MSDQELYRGWWATTMTTEEMFIYKYELSRDRRICSILVPVGSILTSVQIQGEKVVAWFMVPKEYALSTIRQFEIWQTGSLVEAGRRHVATLQFPGNVVEHVFEVVA